MKDLIFHMLLSFLNIYNLLHDNKIYFHLPFFLIMSWYHFFFILILILPQGINRTLLKWIKLWDLFVFGKMRKSKKQKKREKMYENELKFGKRKRHWEYEEEMV